MSGQIPTINSLALVMPGQGAITLLTMTDALGKVIATVQVQHVGLRVGNFARLYVVDSYRQKGYGRALLGAADKLARHSGNEALSCIVHPSNLQAQAFYRRLGFAVVSVWEDGDLLLSRPVMKEAAPADLSLKP
jgi:ribosomal protein S18 acetylase RimI-like enzyme